MLDVFRHCKIHHMGNCIFCDAGEPITIELPPPSERMLKRYRECWEELHSSVTFETLGQWEKNIPNINCECRRFYHDWKASNPPRKDDFFAWTVGLHNAVNAKLGKPIITLQQAREIWMT